MDSEANIMYPYSGISEELLSMKSLISVIGTITGLRCAKIKNSPVPNLFESMGYVHMTGERKNPTRAKNWTMLTKSGILTANGAKINPNAVPVKPKRIRQKGTNKIENPTFIS